MNGFGLPIEKLFMSPVITCYAPVNDHRDQLFPAELKLILGSSPSRQHEFSSGRWCAKNALCALGIADAALLSGPNREPVWPARVNGSISHTSDWAICAVCYTDEVAGLGVDVEQLPTHASLPQEMLFTQNERDWLSAIPANDRHQLEILIFSAKESFYKALFPHYRQYIDYHEVELGIDISTLSFGVTCLSAELKNLVDAFHIEGRYCYFDNHVWSGITLLCR